MSAEPPCLTLTEVAALTLRASVGIAAKAGVTTTPDRSTGDGAAIARLIVARTRGSEEVNPRIIGFVDLVSTTQGGQTMEARVIHRDFYTPSCVVFEFLRSSATTRFPCWTEISAGSPCVGSRSTTAPSPFELV